MQTDDTHGHMLEEIERLKAENVKLMKLNQECITNDIQGQSRATE